MLFLLFAVDGCLLIVGWLLVFGVFLWCVVVCGGLCFVRVRPPPHHVHKQWAREHCQGLDRPLLLQATNTMFLFANLLALRLKHTGGGPQEQ